MRAKRLRMTQRRREALFGLLFISPWLIGLAVFFAYPLLQSIQLSFVNVLNMTDYQVEWAGISHYKEALTGDTWYVKHYLTAMKTMAYQVPLINVFSIFIAILLNRKFPGRGAYRTIFFLPVILGAGFIMTQLTGQGVQEEAMNAVRDVLLPMQVSIYLGPTGTALVSDFLTMITAVLWRSGVQIVIYLSGLQGISNTLYEAARVDSATEWEMFWLITLPMITPIILLNLVYSVVDCFINADDMLFKHIQNIAFQSSRFSDAAAMSWLFFLWVVLLVAVIFLIMRPFVNRVKE